jgi:hypothetical protein
LQPIEKKVKLVGGNFTERVIGGEVFGKQAHIAEEGFKGVGGTALVFQVDFPGIDGWNKGGVRSQVGGVLDFNGVLGHGESPMSRIRSFQVNKGTRRFTEFPLRYTENNLGSLGFAVVNTRFWGVSGVYTPLTPQNLETSPPIPEEPMGTKCR